ncbi:MAG: S9 family peptidase [Flavobacteriaceae bacterium]|nr:S9 family peptidase [Flavobacteriaceae bacterium]
MKKKISAPVATKIPKKLVIHNDARIDNYFWLNERDNKEVEGYLNSENNYTKTVMKHTAKFQEQLFHEMKSRIKEDDTSVPYKLNGYWYLTKFTKGNDYPIYIRKKGTLHGKEEVLFDCNEMAKGYSYFKLGGISISPNNKLACFSIDTVGRRQYALKIKNLETGEIYDEQIFNTSGSSTWANDNKTLFYSRKDDVTLRSDKIYKHHFGEDGREDTLVYHEKDDTFFTFVYKTKSRKFLIIGSASTLTSEYRILSADDPDGNFKLFQPRERKLEYSITHYNGYFYILTNKDGATNFKIMKTPEVLTSKENWEDVIPHRRTILIEDVEIFLNYLVISEREKGLTKLRILSWDSMEDYYLPFDSETYTARIGNNPEFDSDFLRYNYNSLTIPSSVVDYNFSTRENKIMKEQEVLDKSFKKENYHSRRIWATARDGEKIPISMVYKNNIQLDGSNPLLLYAYGSYGSTMDPYFSSIRLSLLNRGFIFAIAHVRGGEYLGREWYEKGKLEFKKNTFNDFIDCSQFLIDNKYTCPNHLYASGGSAGGLLMGVVLNEASHLYNGIIASVPFVDVLTTMLDDSIPLTTGEYDEWGNPNNEEDYFYIKSYSPYDNVKNQYYTNLLVTTGLHDSQVQYWEPAKWVAKLREYKVDNNRLIFNVDMNTGHGGASGRFERLKEVALEYAFLLDLEGISE